MIRWPRAGRATTGRLKRFYEEFTAGVTKGDLRRLFDRDAAQAYRVLTREQDLSRSRRAG